MYGEKHVPNQQPDIYVITYILYEYKSPKKPGDFPQWLNDHVPTVPTLLSTVESSEKTTMATSGKKRKFYGSYMRSFLWKNLEKLLKFHSSYWLKMPHHEMISHLVQGCSLTGRPLENSTDLKKGHCRSRHWSYARHEQNAWREHRVPLSGNVLKKWNENQYRMVPPSYKLVYKPH